MLWAVQTKHTQIINIPQFIVNAGDERNCAAQDDDNYVLAAFY